LVSFRNMTTEQTTDGRKTDGGRTDVQATYTWLYSGLATTVSETIRNPLLVKTQTALKNKKIWRKTIFNKADGIITPCNVARS